MRILMVATLAATATAFAAFIPGKARAAGPEISGPFTYGNLALYFVHRASAPGPVPLTLQEGMAKGTVRVVETGSVNELKIENSGDEDVFIQSGDIVKGGSRQHRVLTVSFVLPKKSGEVPVASYCVEHGRWSARGGESAALFASSADSLPSRAAKLAMKAPAAAGIAPQQYGTAGQAYYAAAETGQRQRAVWDEVGQNAREIVGGRKRAGGLACL